MHSAVHRTKYFGDTQDQDAVCTRQMHQRYKRLKQEGSYLLCKMIQAYKAHAMKMRGIENPSEKLTWKALSHRAHGEQHKLHARATAITQTSVSGYIQDAEPSLCRKD